MISIIVAVSENGVIGKEGKLPWYIPEDLKHFKQLTSGNVVIMGRKTYESIGKPLPNRLNIVITREKNSVIDGCITVNSIKDAIRKAGTDKEIFIIGGGEIYKKSLKFADKVYLTKIHQTIEGDTHFPTLSDKWKEINREDKNGYSFITYDFSR
jgi:dihydrofolate reductase